jgi:NADPH-ferrihemoprotein reductase
MTHSTHHLLDTLDIIFLGTIGLGTIAWFARHQIADKLFKSSSSSTKPDTKVSEVKTGPPKKERNFVKVMQQQVTQSNTLLFLLGSTKLY